MTAMIVGPRVIADKSFLQSLNGPLIDELTMYFTMTSLPTLISEIIADLKLPARKDGRIGEEIVKMLAVKMMDAHGAQPAPLHSLVVGSLHGQQPPMNGVTLPVMRGTPGVSSNASGSQLMVSQLPQQAMWARWARGNFSTEDDEAATAWRAGIESTDLASERGRWMPFAAQLRNPNSLETVVEAVDRVMADRSGKTQGDLINAALTVVRGSMREKASATRYLVGLPKETLITEYAPFAAHAARLYLCFGVGLARDLVNTNPSNTIDLQYLLYAPFCRVFLSLDHLHRKFWTAGAVASQGDFVSGENFKADLKQRNAKRAAMTSAQWASHRDTHGDWPEPISNSIISALWEKHCPNWPRGGSVSPNVGKHIDEIDDPYLKEVLRLAKGLREGR